MGGDRKHSNKIIAFTHFNPHHPCGWWRSSSSNSKCGTFNFNPHHPCGWWLEVKTIVKMAEENFNPHHPCGWWPLRTVFRKFCISYFNPHHPCGWWPKVNKVVFDSLLISIHTTRVGGDTFHRKVLELDLTISIHTTRVGGDIATICNQSVWGVFQSTPPVWVVTIFIFFIINT